MSFVVGYSDLPELEEKRKKEKTKLGQWANLLALYILRQVNQRVL